MQRIGSDGRKRLIYAIICLVVAAVFIIIDRLTKNYFANFFSNAFDTFEKHFVIKDFFYFTLKANEGAAWSFLADVSWAQTFFKIITCFAFVLMGFGYFYAFKNGYKWLQICIAIMFAGTLGNFIDRIAFGYVIDFIGLKFGSYHFPIFNFADICLCVSVIMVIIHLCFIDKNAIFNNNESSKNSSKN